MSSWVPHGLIGPRTAMQFHPEIEELVVFKMVIHLDDRFMLNS